MLVFQPLETIVFSCLAKAILSQTHKISGRYMDRLKTILL